MRSIALGAVVVALGCASSSKPAPAPAVENRPEPAAQAAPRTPPPPEDRFEQMMRTAIAMFTAMGEAAEAGGKDCGKVAAGLERVLDRHAGFIADAKRLQREPALKQRSEAWMAEHKDEILAPLTKFTAVVQHCVADPAFTKVMARLSALDE